MTGSANAARGSEPPAIRMRLRYGVNEAVSWWHFALGPERERIWARLREMDTRIIRIFVFDKFAPDPVTEWPVFASCVEAVLNVGATPMVTFARFPPPFDDPRALRWFAGRCAEVVWSCIDQWGGEVVRDWYWCVWDKPNSEWVSPGFSFEHYRRIYEEVAQGILRWLTPCLRGRKPLIGGPAIDGFQPFWLDWVWRFVNEIDNSLIGFTSWHRYGDWRPDGEAGAPREEAIFQGLIMARTPEYESRALTVARLLNGREILNVCGELNAHAHHELRVSARFNQTTFGAAYYASALQHLMRGGADAEMLWTGTDDGGPYGALNKDGWPTPVFHAKKLCAQYIRYGDWISFPTCGRSHPDLGIVVARGEEGRESALLVHLENEAATYAVAELTEHLAGCDRLLKIDGGTGNQVAETGCKGTVSFDGYGVAVVTNAAPRAERPAV